MDNNCTKKISVLVPVYNVEKYVSRCIESVLTQTYSNFELILVDDGSSDASLAICQNFAKRDSRILVISQENSGAVRARRECIRNASGDYYVFLDSDDYLERNALEIIQSSFEKYRCDCVVYGFKRYYESEDKFVVKDSPCQGVVAPFVTSERKEFMSIFLMNGSKFNPLWRKAVKADVLPKDTDYSTFYHISKGNDLLQSLEIYRNIRSVAFIDAVLYVYVQNQESLSYTFNINRVNHLLVVFNEKFKFLQKDAGLFSSQELRTLKFHFLLRPFVKIIRFVCNSNDDRKDKIDVLKQMFQSEFFTRLNQEYVNHRISTPFRYRIDMFFFRHKIYRLMLLLRRSERLCKKSVVRLLHNPFACF